MTIKKLINTIKHDGLVIFPTDTVLALSCLANSKRNIERMYQIKRRPSHKPMSVLVASIAQLAEIAILNDLAYQLIASHPLGTLTLVCNAKSDINYPCVFNGKIGVRVTNYTLAVDLINAVGAPIVATSVNFTDEPALIDTKDIPDDIRHMVDFVLEGRSSGSVPSKVIDITTDKPIELRI